MKLDKVRSWSINCYRFHLVDDIKSCFSSLEKLKWPCDAWQRAIKQIGGDLQNSCTVTHLSKCPPFLEIGWKLDWFTLTHRDGQCLQFLQLTLLISCNSSLAALFEPLFEDISCPASITVNIRSLIECQKIRNLVEKKMIFETQELYSELSPPLTDRPEPKRWKCEAMAKQVTPSVAVSPDVLNLPETPKFRRRESPLLLPAAAK